MLQNSRRCKAIINLHLPTMTVFSSAWITSSHSILCSRVGLSSSTDTFLLCKVWQEEITESLLVFLLKSLLDDNCICSWENELCEQSNICLSKGLIKRLHYSPNPYLPQPPPWQPHTHHLAAVLSLYLEISFLEGRDFSLVALVMWLLGWKE